MIKRIVINNMMQFQHFEAEVPAVALLIGSNGRGKSSVAECMKYPWGRTHDPDIIFGDEPAGEIILTLEDGTLVRTVASRVENKTVRMIKPAGKTRWEYKREQIDALVNSISYDPMAFLKLSATQQTEKLLDVMPLAVSREELQAAVGDTISVPEIPEGQHGLVTVNSSYDQIYKKRTGLNGEVDTLRKHAGQLDEALKASGAADGTDWAARAVELRRRKEIIEHEIAVGVSEINKEYNTLRANKAESVAADYREIDQDIDGRIRALEAERVQRKSTLDYSATNELVAAKADAETREKALRARHAAELAELPGKIATAAERERAFNQAEGSRAAAEKARMDADEKQALATAMTRALDNLNALKKTLAKRLAIKDIVIGEDGRIWREEESGMVPFAKWNTASRIAFCLKIAVLAHGKCGFVVVDDIGGLDEDALRGLEKACKHYAATQGIQFILGKAQKGSLDVRDGLSTLFDQAPAETASAA